MSMIIDEEHNTLSFAVPNSEAAIIAQHISIRNRTVGSYYMSDRYMECKTFLADFSGEYYIDVGLSVKNARFVIDLLEENSLNDYFKYKLVPQSKKLELLESFLKSGESYYKIPAPTVNANHKYLKLDNEDAYVECIKYLLLGDLMTLVFKKIGSDGFLIYIKPNHNLQKHIEDKSIIKILTTKNKQ